MMAKTIEQRTKPQKQEKEKGQSIVELSLSLVFLLVLLAGVADLGRAYYTFISLRDAAQEGAAYGSINPRMCSQIRDRVRDTSSHPIDLSTLGTDDINVLVGGVHCESASLVESACNADEIQVEVTMDGFQLATPFLGMVLGTQELTLRADVQDAIIVNPCQS